MATSRSSPRPEADRSQRGPASASQRHDPAADLLRSARRGRLDGGLPPGVVLVRGHPLPGGVRGEPPPLEIALPRPRTDPASILSGSEVYLVGGLVDGQPSSSVLTTTTTPTGSFGPWSEGPPLPAERVDAALALFNGGRCL